jgi:hypothetical protein
VTYHVVIAFDREVEGDLKPGKAREVMSRLCHGNDGALAFDGYDGA